MQQPSRLRIVNGLPPIGPIFRNKILSQFFHGHALGLRTQECTSTDFRQPVPEQLRSLALVCCLRRFTECFSVAAVLNPPDRCSGSLIDTACALWSAHRLPTFLCRAAAAFFARATRCCFVMPAAVFFPPLLPI